MRHKDQLKRDITKKRSMQEHELRMDIKRQIDRIKGSVVTSGETGNTVKMVTLTAAAPKPSLPVPEKVVNNVEERKEEVAGNLNNFESEVHHHEENNVEDGIEAEPET